MATLPLASSAPSPASAARRRARPAPHLLLALVVTVMMTVCRTGLEWRRLAAGFLPDNDDMMRLAEVRDWLAGQGFHDLMQYRLGMGDGASMHWSRIADAGPAALLALFTPLLGEAAATTAMLVGWQALLLVAYLLLSARNARLLAGDRAQVVAVVLAALAFPTITLFKPGRIDHHGIQIVLALVVVGAILARATWRSGLLGGVAAGLSMAVGLEVAPELVAAFAALGLMWIVRGAPEHRRLGGFGVGLGGTTLALLVFARPVVWPAEWCDGFTPASVNATMASALAFGALGLAGGRMPDIRARVLLGTVAGGAVAAWALHASAVCFGGPYGALHPFLKIAFMDNVSEARGMFAGQQSWLIGLAFGGLSLAALIPLAIILRDPARRGQWWPFALFLVLSVVAAVAQIRVTYIVAGLATLPFVAMLTGLLDDPRKVGLRLLLWLAGSGIVYHFLATGLDALAASHWRKAQVAQQSCPDVVPLQVLARLPRGTVMAPLDSGAYVIGMTPHRTFAAPYHRNNRGNMAMYRFFLSPPDRAQAMARSLGVDYVVTCPYTMEEAVLDDLRRGSLIEALQAGRVPAWLTPVVRVPAGAAVYRVGRAN